MKKVTYLMTILFAVVLMSTSCEKENVTPDNGITVEDLVGDWYFQSLEFNGSVTYGCDADLNLNYDLITMDLKNVTTTKMTLFTDCVDAGQPDWEVTYDYTLIDNILEFNHTSLKFEIVNADTFDGTILKLKLYYNSATSDLPKGGIYTLTNN